MSPEKPAVRIVDPRAVRVALASSMAATSLEPIVLEPPAVPLAPGPRMSGTGMPGGVDLVLVNDAPVSIRLERLDGLHAVLVHGGGNEAARHPVMMLPIEPGTGPGVGPVRRELIVDGWRIEVEVESERRASLRERARRGREETAHGGPTEVRAIIPGRVVGVSIVAGDSVVAGQQLLVVEAMKMQNELRAPRDGVIASVVVGPGRTIEVGDLLLVLE